MLFCLTLGLTVKAVEAVDAKSTASLVAELEGIGVQAIIPTTDGQIGVNPPSNEPPATA